MRRAGALVTAVLVLAAALLAAFAAPAAAPASVRIPPPTQPLWVWQNPLPQGNSLGSVQVLDALRAVAVGDAGTILTTVDGGASWTRAISGVGQTLFGDIVEEVAANPKGPAAHADLTLAAFPDVGNLVEEQVGHMTGIRGRADGHHRPRFGDVRGRRQNGCPAQAVAD